MKVRHVTVGACTDPPIDTVPVGTQPGHLAGRQCRQVVRELLAHRGGACLCTATSFDSVDPPGDQAGPAPIGVRLVTTGVYRHCRSPCSTNWSTSVMPIDSSKRRDPAFAVWVTATTGPPAGTASVHQLTAAATASRNGGVGCCNSRNSLPIAQVRLACS